MQNLRFHLSRPLATTLHFCEPINKQPNGETELDRAICLPDPAATIQHKIDLHIQQYAIANPYKDSSFHKSRVLFAGAWVTHWYHKGDKDENISPTLQNLLTSAALQAFPRFAASTGARSRTAHLRNAHLDKHDKPLGADPPQSSHVTSLLCILRLVLLGLLCQFLRF
ncbi:hypothetical protein T492DRAFT_527513 [Pavlovales sp. CCMP2436]|nr:hypothetical protein T492DRAFT_527513 [Pavlovales sp. CCMP2436]